jgi:riboflavin synthase
VVYNGRRENQQTRKTSVFTGLVEETGNVQRLERRGAAAQLTIRAELVCSDANIGDSISVNGCCLTVVERQGNALSFDVGSETLARTNLGELSENAVVNLERALRVGDRLGGHYVTGHIDGLGKITEIRTEGEWLYVRFSTGENLCRQMASKGSIAVDGISLTLVDVGPDFFTVMLVPHTLAMTTLGQAKVGSTVNLETDVLAKYVERQLAGVMR